MCIFWFTLWSCTFLFYNYFLNIGYYYLHSYKILNLPPHRCVHCKPHCLLPEEACIQFLLVPSLVICYVTFMYPAFHNKPCTGILSLDCILHSMQSSSCISESITISSLLYRFQDDDHSGSFTKEIKFSRQF